jgi:glyoxylase-like metal-dependent hydrolase (beta-lactamase superfamily II)
MDVIGLLPNLDLLRFEIGQAYLWRDGDSTTLIDTGTSGAGDGIRALVDGSLDRVVLTHFHGDHTGSAAEIRTWSDAPTYAHRADAALIRGEGTPPPLVLADWERSLYERIGAPHLLTGPPAVVDHELDGGEVLDFGGGARILSIPGHTEGSIAVYLPRHRVLFTGDAVAESGGTVLLGVFNQDPARAMASLTTLADLDVEVACFGHGEPVTSDAGSGLRAAITAPPPNL